MISSSWDRAVRLRAAASILAMVAVAVGVLVLAVGMSLPEAWWPRTGHAFTTRPAEDPCGLIAGPAKAHCERRTITSAYAEHPAGAAWRLVPLGAGLAALILSRRRTFTGQGRP
ncbi:hypothetical protein ACWD0J_10140 [Streptomyces sp. NPDC003011]